MNFMKLAFVSPFFLFISSVLMGQNNPDASTTDSTGTIRYDEREAPQYPNGEIGVAHFIAQNIKYPIEARAQRIVGRVYVHFVIYPSGQLDSIHIVKSVHPLLDEEVIRAVKLLPPWRPSMRDGGKPIRQYYTVPINFQLEEDVDSIYYQPEAPPRFPEGEDALKRYISSHLQYPKEYRDACISGKLRVSFVVGATGLVEQVCLERPLDRFVDEEVMRLVAMMPRWIPARDHGKPVDAWYTIPICFF